MFIKLAILGNAEAFVLFFVVVVVVKIIDKPNVFILLRILL